MSNDQLLAIFEFLAIPDLAHLRETMNLFFVMPSFRLPRVVVRWNEVRDWLEAGVLASTRQRVAAAMAIWGAHTKTLIVEGTLNSFSWMCTSQGVCTLPRLQTLDIDTLSGLDVQNWQRLLACCPVLHRLRIDKLPYTFMTGSQWQENKRDWVEWVVAYPGQTNMSPTALLDYFVQPRLESLQWGDPRLGLSYGLLWTLEHTKRLVQSTKRLVKFIINYKLADPDDNVLQLLAAYPRMETFAVADLKLRTSTIEKMIVAWPWMTSLPPDDITSSDKAAFSSTLLDLQRPWTQLRATLLDLDTMFRDWSLQDLSRLLGSSTKWEFVHIEATDHARFQSDHSIDDKTIATLVQSCPRLHTLQLNCPCRVSAHTLSLFSLSPDRRYSIQLGPVWVRQPDQKALPTAPDITVDTLLAFAAHNSVVTVRLTFAVLTSLTADDLQTLLMHKPRLNMYILLISTATAGAVIKREIQRIHISDYSRYGTLISGPLLDGEACVAILL